jgi:hypothetical protein
MKKFPEQVEAFNLKGVSRPPRPVQRGVSKAVEDGRKPPALGVGHPRNFRESVDRTVLKA